MCSISKKCASIILILLLTGWLLTLFVEANAETGSTIVGVKPGDLVKYKVTKFGDNIAWLLYPYAVWIKVEVLNVSDDLVTILETIHDSDGSEFSRDFSWSIHAYRKAPFSYIIPANYGPRDKIDEIPIFDEDSDKYMYVDLTLNDTVLRSYGEVTREVNQLKWSQVSWVFPNKVNFTYELYWDKSTGFLLEGKLAGYFVGYEEYYEVHPPSTYIIEVDETNVWEMQKPKQSFAWLITVIPIGIIIVVTMAIGLKNKREKGAT